MFGRPTIIERDQRILMRDGVHLAANIFLPGEGAWPTILSVTPYGKDKLPDWVGMTLMRLSGVRFGRLDCSSWTGFKITGPAVLDARRLRRGASRCPGHAQVRRSRRHADQRRR